MGCMCTSKGRGERERGRERGRCHGGLFMFE